MPLKTCMRIAALAMICSAIAGQAAAAGPTALNPADVQHYEAAFSAVDRGDFIDAEMNAVELKDKSLLGHLSFQQLMHPSAHKASFDELAGWLTKYADLPVADRVFALAAKRQPAGAPAPRQPILAGLSWSNLQAAAQRLTGRPTASDKARAARDAFYAGDAKRALELAPQGGDNWIAGLAAYRLKDYVQAQQYFAQVAQDETEDAWLRAAGGYWAARAATAVGDLAQASGFLRAAAAFPGTFYGMIADRQAHLQTAARPQPLAQAETGDFVLASYTAPDASLSDFVQSDPRAHRAAALAQIGRSSEAALELKAGLTLAKTDAERSKWTSLLLALNEPLSIIQPAATTRGPAPSPADYPTPSLEPKWGFTLDKALVYAIVRQESRFNPAAVSPAGAVGLMQLMPEAAARAAGDDKLKADMSPLFDPAFNLRVGQDYVTWLMERGVGYDLLKTVAAYNGGPGMLQKTAAMLGDDADSLLIIECLPAQETRQYVEKVVAGYWTYRKMFGEDSRTLDAVAQGAKFVDARLDRQP